MAFCIIFSSIELSIAQVTSLFSEGVLDTKVSMYGVDLSPLTDEANGTTMKERMEVLKKKIPAAKAEALKTKIESNPMMGLAMVLLPPRGTIYLKKDVVLGKIYGLGYYLEHYHNLQSDEGVIYMSSLEEPLTEATASYQPSKGYEKVYSGNKMIHADQFNITKESGSVTVAGYPCQRSIYTAKNLNAEAPSSMAGMTTPIVHKLVVYTSDKVSKSINFSHPYYLPEDHGILRIDAYYDESKEPSAVYEVTAVKPQTVTDELLAVKKSKPLYAIDDVTYGMKVMTIMFGGLSSLKDDQDADDDTDAEE
ncbi:hypothetical protein SAMN05216436_10518 [bacterium A37T11]|nr:hypothetical protein SAMN05216436_10518 [bacterium A37T11]